jgi:predicted dehydrogenase
VKVAVAGLGWWGKQIVRAISQSPHFEVLYGVDPAPPPGIADFAREFAIKLETELAVALRDSAVEGVILATPHKLHEEQILAVVAAGKNVFCEKPLTMTGAGATRVVEACKRSGKVLGVGHERRWEPAFEELAQMVNAGTLGRLLYLDANISHDLFRKADPTNWRLDPEHAPAGMMTAVGIHMTDLFTLFAGPAAEVRAQTARQLFQPPAQDFVTATIAFKSGARGQFTSLSTPPYYGRLTVFGDAGWVEIVSEANVDQGKPTILTHGDGKTRRTMVYQAIDAVRLAFDAWADAVEGRAIYRFAPEQVIDNIKLFEAIVQSSREGGKAIAL